MRNLLICLAIGTAALWSTEAVSSVTCPQPAPQTICPDSGQVCPEVCQANFGVCTDNPDCQASQPVSSRTTQILCVEDDSVSRLCECLPSCEVKIPNVFVGWPTFTNCQLTCARARWLVSWWGDGREDSFLVQQRIGNGSWTEVYEGPDAGVAAVLAGSTPVDVRFKAINSTGSSAWTYIHNLSDMDCGGGGPGPLD